MRCEGSGGGWRKRRVALLSGRRWRARPRQEAAEEESGGERKRKKRKNEEVVEVAFLDVASFSSSRFSSRATLCAPLSNRFVVVLPPLRTFTSSTFSSSTPSSACPLDCLSSPLVSNNSSAPSTRRRRVAVEVE
jgi:hypothetical protein